MNNVAELQTLTGAKATGTTPDLLIEVPHGADRRSHYGALASQLQGELPKNLIDFFFVNTDVGAYDLGLAVAKGVVERQPTRVARVVRCLIPRTFIDTNRQPNTRGDDLENGGVTPGLQPYIHNDQDRARLVALHEQYTELVAGQMAETVANQGQVLIPHTYGPVSMGIAKVDDDIVRNLHWALDPVRAHTWPVRPEVDLIHTTEDGTSLAPNGLIDKLAASYRKDGVQVALGDTYFLHPSTMGFVWSSRYPGRVLTLEVRRDLLVERYEPFREMTVSQSSIARYASPLIDALCAAHAKPDE